LLFLEAHDARGTMVGMDKDTSHNKGLLVLVGVVVLGFIVTALHTLSLKRDITTAQNELTEAVLSLESFQQTVTTKISKIDQMHITMADELYKEQQRIDKLSDNVYDFNRDVRKLTGSVDTLEKLTTTDPELLQKYSKVYFLNEHYTPADLVEIDEKYDLPNGKTVTIHADVWPFLENLLERAERNDLNLMVLSGYRSFDEQNTLKQNYLTQYGTGANTFSADQGYSEHQLGTTVDFTNTTIAENIDLFETTPEFEWLKRNAHKYGFVMSYPEGNAYYQYEPWHWRFVGTDLARDLHNDEKYFYDLEQREIDSYIPELFD